MCCLVWHVSSPEPALEFVPDFSGGVVYHDPRMVPATGLNVAAWATCGDADIPLDGIYRWSTIVGQNTSSNQESWSFQVNVNNSGSVTSGVLAARHQQHCLHRRIRVFCWRVVGVDACCGNVLGNARVALPIPNQASSIGSELGFSCYSTTRFVTSTASPRATVCGSGFCRDA